MACTLTLMFCGTEVCMYIKSNYQSCTCACLRIAIPYIESKMIKKNQNLKKFKRLLFHLLFYDNYFSLCAQARIKSVKQ